MDVAVRDAVEADAAAVARIYVDSWNGGCGPLLGMRSFDADQVARWAAEMASGARRWWVAEREGQIVGFVGVGPSRDPVEPGLGELDTIAVQPSHWRTGVGRALMDVALRSLSSEYVDAVLWTVVGYERGQRIYQAMGWTSEGRTRADGQQVCFQHRLGRRTDSPGA